MDKIALYRNIMLKIDNVVKKHINEMNYNISNKSFTDHDFSLFIDDNESYRRYNMSAMELEHELNNNPEFDNLWVSGVDDGLQIWTADETLFNNVRAFLRDIERENNISIKPLREDLNLNRGDVYQFGNICLRPLVKDTIKKEKPNWQIQEQKDDRVIGLLYKAGNKRMYISLLNNFGNKPFIRLSMYNFTSTKINTYGFVDNDKVYIIDKDKVLGVWNNPRICKVETDRKYRDANGSDSMFTQVNKQWLIDNADYVFDIDTETKEYARYITNYKNFA